MPGNLVSEDTNGVKDIFVHEGFLKYAPTVLSITRADANPAFTLQDRYTVSFSKDVTGVDATDFKLVKSGASSAAITDVSAVSGSSYTVTVSTGTPKSICGSTSSMTTAFGILWISHWAV